MSYGVGSRRGSDPALLWLWHRLVATALIGLLAWEPPYAAGVAQEMAKSPPQKKKKKKRHNCQNKQQNKNTVIRTKILGNVALYLFSSYTSCWVVQELKSPGSSLRDSVVHEPD